MGKCDVILNSGEKCDRNSVKTLKVKSVNRYICAVHERHTNLYYFQDKDNLKKCKTCQKYIDKDKFILSLCDKCSNLAKRNREKNADEACLTVAYYIFFSKM